MKKLRIGLNICLSVKEKKETHTDKQINIGQYLFKSFRRHSLN